MNRKEETRVILLTAFDTKMYNEDGICTVEILVESTVCYGNIQVQCTMPYSKSLKPASSPLEIMKEAQEEAIANLKLSIGIQELVWKIDEQKQKRRKTSAKSE